MVKIDADPTDGPTLDSSDPTGTLVSVVASLVGIGFFLALWQTASNTTQPVFQGLMNSVPGLNAGGGSQTLPVDGGGL